MSLQVCEKTVLNSYQGCFYAHLAVQFRNPHSEPFDSAELRLHSEYPDNVIGDEAHGQPHGISHEISPCGIISAITRGMYPAISPQGFSGCGCIRRGPFIGGQPAQLESSDPSGGWLSNRPFPPTHRPSDIYALRYFIRSRDTQS